MKLEHPDLSCASSVSDSVDQKQMDSLFVHHPAVRKQVAVQRWDKSKLSYATDSIAEEVPIAMVYNRISHVVMMATPQDLQDFALGFSLTEQILLHPEELYEIDVVEQKNGIELQIQISSQRMAELKQHRRNLTGRTGCGICGAESLQQALKPLPPVAKVISVEDEAIEKAVNSLGQFQPLQQTTGACHGAAWCNLNGEILKVREDVGRHNALDKLIGSLAESVTDWTQGFVLISSRASYEMVQKVVTVGIGNLIAVSAPTGLALQMAQETGLNLIGFARPQRHTHYNK